MIVRGLNGVTGKGTGVGTVSVCPVKGTMESTGECIDVDRYVDG